MPKPTKPKAAIITIGNEILLGKTLNTNMAYLGSKLAALGIPVQMSFTIQDDPIAITKALDDVWPEYDVVISTGGLGPTEDDLSKAAIAEFFGVQLSFDEDVWTHVQSLFSRRGMPTPPINRCQAMVPEGFEALRNDRGTAPGLHYEKDGKHFFALQGVPLEMRYIYVNHIQGILEKAFPAVKPIFQKTLHTHGVSESRLAELFCLSELPENVSLAWLPQTGRVDMRFYGHSQDAINEGITRAKKKIGRFIWNEEDSSPAELLSSLLLTNGNTLSIAESCTGGWVAKLITDLPGASKLFTGGVIAYSNEIKEKLLKVNIDTLLRKGAVSNETALEMARGIKLLTGSSHAISTTGIAGPDGGSDEKPVGMVCFGFIAEGKHWTKQQVFTGDRESIRLKSAEFALLELIRYLQGRSI